MLSVSGGSCGEAVGIKGKVNKDQRLAVRMSGRRFQAYEQD